MRSLSIQISCAALFLAACSSSKSVCDGVNGTCVALTVESSTVSSVDGLHIVGTLAVDGKKETSGPATALPVHVALLLPATASGAWHLEIDGVLNTLVVGHGTADATVTPGQHTAVTCTLLGNGGADLAGSDLTGADLAGTDAARPQCDPKGGSGAPPCVWRWQTPSPQGDDLLSIVALADNDTFALTESGLLLHRDNAGWSALATRPGVPYSASSLFGAGNDLYISGSTENSSAQQVPAVFHSPDKGITWAQESLPGALTGSGAYAGAASSGSNVVVPSFNGHIFVRDAAGVWTLQTVGTLTFLGAAAHFGDMIVVGTDGSIGAIAYSSDSGASFTLASTLPAISPLQLRGGCIGAGGGQPSFWAVGTNAILHSIGPAPSVWTQQGSAATAGIALEGCVATDDQHAWAWGGSTVLITTNGGTTWGAVTTPPNTTKTLLGGGHSPTGGSALTVVGTQGAIFRSTDGNSFTEELKGLHDPLAAVHGVAPGALFAVGSTGAIYRTVDDGTTWTKLSVPAQSGTTADLTAVWGASSTDIYAIGALGGAAVIVHSADGQTFTKYAGIFPAGTKLSDVWGSAAHGVYAVGMKGSGPNSQRVVLRTTNQGQAWSEVPIVGFTDTLGSSNLAYSTFSLGADVWVTGTDGLIYHSTDGSNFTAQAAGVGTTSIGRIRGVTGHVIATLGTDPGAFIDTTDAGATWVAHTNVWNSAGDWVAFTPSESTIFVVTPSAQPVFSTDKGVTWKLLQTGIINEQASITDFFAFADNDVFAVGNNGIVHYGN